MRSSDSSAAAMASKDQTLSSLYLKNKPPSSQKIFLRTGGLSTHEQGEFLVIFEAELFSFCCVLTRDAAKHH